MTDISTLIPDIYNLVQNKKGWFDAETSDALRNSLAGKLGDHFNEPRYSATRATLRMSSLGPQCPRALWYRVNNPGMAESMPPWAEVKFAYGHVLEGLALTFAKAAGHEVTGEQDELTLDGIVGHRDAVVDGMVVDVKSCSSIQFAKFKNKSIYQNDAFGYLDQLSAYVVASADDPLVRVKDKGAILAIDKTLGHMVLYEHSIPDAGRGIQDRIKQYKAIAGQPEPPPCECGRRTYGTSGNVILDPKASYSPYKFCCCPGLRTFIYSDGPRYFVRVVKRPDVTEINKEGKVVYH